MGEHISNPSLNMDANLVFHHFNEYESLGGDIKTIEYFTTKATNYGKVSVYLILSNKDQSELLGSATYLFKER